MPPQGTWTPPGLESPSSRQTSTSGFSDAAAWLSGINTELRGIIVHPLSRERKNPHPESPVILPLYNERFT